MQNLSKLLLLSASLSFVATEAIASETIVINPTNKAPLFDGRCGKDEWQAATKIELPAQASVFLMHDKNSLYVCAKGKAEDYAVIDLYIEHAETGHLYNLHASAQLGERILTDKEWSEQESWWNHKDWSGFWVPYAGNEDTENGKRTKFLKGSHREVQVLRKKFVGNTWNIMIGLSAINHEGNSAEFFFPEKAVDTDKSTWAKFSFAE